MGRELSPILTGVVVAGRIGAAIAAEIGTMKVTEQIDALRVMAVSPIRFLVTPRLLAIVLMMPVLVVYANLVGDVGGWFVAENYAGISSHMFLESIRDFIEPWDIIGGLIKGAVFGAIIATIGCHKGLNAQQGAEGVGMATTKSVVLSIILIFIANYFLSVILYVHGAEMEQPVIEFRNVEMHFGPKVVLDRVSFSVAKGETLAVIGPSGTGKSTVLKLLIGLLKPQEGQVVIQGQPVEQFNEEQWNQLRQHMGMVFQYSALFDFLDVGENVAFGLRQHTSLSEEAIQKRVKDLLEAVGLSGNEHVYPAQLSGGMQKRVGLARALALQPDIILYDEPPPAWIPLWPPTSAS